MKPQIFLTATLLTIGLVMVAGCAHQGQGHQRSAGEYIDDATITTRVKSALLAEDDVKSFDISVETYQGTVQLSGFVDSQWQINKAVEVTSAVNGVQRVKNNLIHKPS